MYFGITIFNEGTRMSEFYTVVEFEDHIASDVMTNLSDIMQYPYYDNKNPLCQRITRELIEDFISFWGDRPTETEDCIRSLCPDIYRIEYGIKHILTRKYPSAFWEGQHQKLFSKLLDICAHVECLLEEVTAIRKEVKDV